MHSIFICTITSCRKEIIYDTPLLYQKTATSHVCDARRRCVCAASHQARHRLRGKNYPGKSRPVSRCVPVQSHYGSLQKIALSLRFFGVACRLASSLSRPPPQAPYRARAPSPGTPSVPRPTASALILRRLPEAVADELVLMPWICRRRYGTRGLFTLGILCFLLLSLDLYGDRITIVYFSLLDEN